MDSLRPLLRCLALVLLSFTFSEARVFLIGGQENSWKVPPSPDDFNKWSGKMRFLIGDFLVLEYDPKADSVLQVTKEDYKICNCSKPIKAYNDSDTKIVLYRSRPFCFISGAQGHCEMGQKLLLTVLSPRHGSRAHPPSVSRALVLSPAEFITLTPAQANDGWSLKGGSRSVSVAMFLGSLVGLGLV